MNKKIVWLVLVILLAVGIWWWFGLNVPTTTYTKDQIFADNYTIPAGQKVVVKDGATLTFERDLDIQGILSCENGPLNLVVKGIFRASGQVECNRTPDLPADDPGNSMAIVAENVDIVSSAIIVANSHVQLVTNADVLVKTAEDFNKLYESVEKDRTGKFRIGPLTPVEEIPANTPGLPVSVSGHILYTLAKTNLNWLNVFFPVARAQEPAVDEAGKPVLNTVKVGGWWYVGNPGQNPPPQLTVPTPPKGVNKIVLDFNFGNNGVELNDFVLTGPDGRSGADDVNSSCTARGKDGEDAMRFNVRAANIKLNNFDLHLGNGGDGGTATTTKDCDPGTATGGAGASGGNFKMVAEGKFEIVGAFNIYPGRGGAGGAATAYGKQGEDGCAGEAGGVAIGTGGKGGDNKKLLTVTGAVSGTENVNIQEMVGGNGGEAVAAGGNGGNGTGPKCDGGPGGKATAAGGKGGDTSCSKFACTGGDGANASATPGNGGNGGMGTAKDPGGNGGKGGDASASFGTGGKGKTASGSDGTNLAENGGNGGNGGDGCGPGKGGKGGSGKPDGIPGKDGKNLCVDEKKPGAGVVGTEPKPEIPPATGAVDSFFDVVFEIQPNQQSFNHRIGASSCPQAIGSFQVIGTNTPTGARWEAQVPSGQAWLNVTAGGDVGGGGQVLFTCQLQEYVTQNLSTTVNINIKDASGRLLQQLPMRVNGQIQAD